MAHLFEVRNSGRSVAVMRFAKCLSAIVLCLAAAAPQGHANELPAKVIEFFRARDRWLLERIRAELPPFQLTKSQTRVRDALSTEEARLADNKAKLEPIQRRIAKNKGKPSLAVLVKKDQARAKEFNAAIQASEERIATLREELPAEEEQAKSEEAKWQQRLPQVVMAKFLEQRAELTLMPPGKGELSPGHLQVGDVGLLPQWPVVLFNVMQGGPRAALACKRRGHVVTHSPAGSFARSVGARRHRRPASSGCGETRKRSAHPLRT